jgi:hypothetical protein
MLASHKLVRWLVFLMLPLAWLGLAMLSPTSRAAAGLFGVSVVVVIFGALAITWVGDRAMPRAIALCGWFVVAAVAGLLAWKQALFGRGMPTWEPTRRPTITA